MSVHDETRYTEVRRTVIISLITTGVLAVLQAVIGYLSGSTAVLATAVHFGLDLLTGVAILYAVSTAVQGPDAEHPYGHGKAEPLVALLIGVMLVLAGFEIISEAVSALARPIVEAPGSSALAIAAVGVLAKEALYRYQNSVGKRLHSEPLLASAKDSRADELASLAALVGVGLALLGYPKLDPIAALLVGVLILRTAYEVGSESVWGLMDRPAPREVEREIRHVAESVPGVLEAFHIRTRRSGPFTMTDLSVHVDEDLTIRQGHDIAVEVRRRILTEVDGIVEAFVHIHVGPHEEIQPEWHRHIA